MKVFVAITVGQAISAAGSGLTIFAIQWLVWTQYRSGSALALLWILVALPYIFLGPVAGALVDRMDRRLAMLLADSLSGLVVLAAAWALAAPGVTLWAAYAVVLAVACLRTFHGPALSASIPQLVEGRHLTRANSLYEFSLGGARLLAPALGGVLLGLGWNPRGLLLLDAASFLLGAAVFAYVRIPSPVPETQSSSGARERLTSGMAHGFRYLRDRRDLLAILALFAVINLLGSSLSVLIPQLVTEKFHAGPGLLGALEAAIGGGAVAGSAILLAWGGPGRLEGGVLAALGLGAILQTWAGLAGRAWLLVGVLGGAVAVWQIANTLCTTLFQRAVPAELQGRVFALKGSLELLTWPASSALAGLLAPAVMGADQFLALGGVLSLAVVGAAAASVRKQ